MAPKATVVKVALQISDMDRHYYAGHSLTMAQHPSETDRRLMVRLLAFALFAEERLEFGRGLSNDAEPDLWRRDYTGLIELWIDLGQPDESRIKKACSRAQQAVVITYGGQASDLWWSKIAPALTRLKNLTVIDIPGAIVDQLETLVQRSMQMNCLVQDGELQMMADSHTVTLRPTLRLAATDA